MRHQISFTKDGLRAFSMVVLSCFPVHYELNADAMMYLRGVMKGDGKLDGEVLLSKIPALKNSILEFAKQSGYSAISAGVVWEFFAGFVHYQKILLDFEENKLHILPGSIYSLRTIFAHLVLPVEIVGYEKDGFVGRYKKGKFDFVVKGLVASESDKKTFSETSLANPKTVLIHYAAIVDANPHSNVIKLVSQLQEHLENFLSACEFLQKKDGVNYNIFPRNCRRETEKIFEKVLI